MIWIINRVSILLCQINPNDMKRIIQSLVCILSMSLSLTSCQSGQVRKDMMHIVADIDGMKDSVTVMTLDYGSWPPKQKRYAVENGRLDLFLPVDYPYLLSLRSESSLSDYIDFPVIAGEIIEIRGSFGDYKMSGSGFYREYALAEEMQKPFHAKMVQLRDAFDSRMAELSKDYQKNEALINREIEKYRSDSDVVNRELQNVVLDYILTHPKEEVSITLLDRVKPEQLEIAINSIDPKVREGRLKLIADALLKQVQNNQISKGVVEGSFAPNFTLPDMNGRSLTLSSLRGKWVVLDFWGSWCGWCMKGFPKMKAYYKKYADKCEIIGVNCRDTEEQWRKTIDKYNLPWLHVYNGKNGDVPDIFGIKGYPTKIIINPEGKIAKIILGENKDYYDSLDALLNQ